MEFSTLFTPQVIENLGFSVVIGIAFFILVATIVKWLMNRIDEQAEQHQKNIEYMYRTYRSDIKEITAKHTEALNNVTEAFKNNLKKLDERDRILKIQLKDIKLGIDYLKSGQEKIENTLKKKKPC